MTFLMGAGIRKLVSTAIAITVLPAAGAGTQNRDSPGVSPPLRFSRLPLRFIRPHKSGSVRAVGVLPQACFHLGYDVQTDTLLAVTAPERIGWSVTAFDPATLKCRWKAPFPPSLDSAEVDFQAVFSLIRKADSAAVRKLRGLLSA